MFFNIILFTKPELKKKIKLISKMDIPIGDEQNGD